MAALLADAGTIPTRSFNPTEERILTATLGLIGRRGVRRLAMQEISEAAGVSRGTLYRYFPSKDLVLAAAADFDEARFGAGLDQALAAVADDGRMAAFLSYAFDFIRTHPARSLFESEPGFVLGYLLDRLPNLRRELVVRLGPEVDVLPVVREGRLTREEVADLVVRLFARAGSFPKPTTARSCARSNARWRCAPMTTTSEEPNMEETTTTYGENPLAGMDPEMARNPQPVFKALREGSPVMSVDMPGGRRRCRAVAQGGDRRGAAPSGDLLVEHGRGRPEEQAADDPAADRPARTPQVPPAPRPALRPAQDGPDGRRGVETRQPPHRPVRRPRRGRLRP